MRPTKGDRVTHRVHGTGTVIALHPDSARIRRESNGRVDYVHLRDLDSEQGWQPDPAA